MGHIHRVTTSPDLIPDDRNFGARVEKNVLLLPEKFLPLLVEYKIETSDLFYALTLTESRAVAKALGWSLNQVVKARLGLSDLLQRSIAPPPPTTPPKASSPSFGPPPPYKGPSSLPPRHSWGPLPPYPPSSIPPKKKKNG